MTDQWSFKEVELIVEDYLSMLVEELAGRSISKTHHRNALRPLLTNRSDGSIEFKHQNISAVFIKLGLPFIKGYKPRSNYQQIVEEAVIKQLTRQKVYLEPKFDEFAHSSVSSASEFDFSSIIESPPERQTIASEMAAQYHKRPIKINYLEREQRNSDLGTKGEKLVLDYERWRLSNLGRNSLAEKVEWIAQHHDGAGFDILSKNANGTDKYIEVKTTKLTKHTPIFFTKNEFEFSLKNRESFNLYRVFNFNDNPKLFALNGCFDEFCQKEALLYSGRF